MFYSCIILRVSSSPLWWIKRIKENNVSVQKITDAEWRVMHVVWKHRRISANDVFAPVRPLVDTRGSDCSPVTGAALWCFRLPCAALIRPITGEGAECRKMIDDLLSYPHEDGNDAIWLSRGIDVQWTGVKNIFREFEWFLRSQPDHRFIDSYRYASESTVP